MWCSRVLEPGVLSEILWGFGKQIWERKYFQGNEIILILSLSFTVIFKIIFSFMGIPITSCTKFVILSGTSHIYKPPLYCLHGVWKRITSLVFHCLINPWSVLFHHWASPVSGCCCVAHSLCISRNLKCFGCCKRWVWPALSTCCLAGNKSQPNEPWDLSFPGEPGHGSVTCITQCLIWKRIKKGADTSSADFPEYRLILVQAVKVQGPSNLTF